MHVTGHKALIFGSNILKLCDYISVIYYNDPNANNSMKWKNIDVNLYFNSITNNP